MDLSSKLWKVIKETFTPNYSYFDRLEKTNKQLEKLGMLSTVEIYHDQDTGNEFYCKWIERDMLLFDINFFHLFLNIFIKGDYIFYFNNRWIYGINELIIENDLPYRIKFENNEIKLYEVILKEISLKL